MPMREECKFFESRTYANGETVRKCDLDLAPEAPWRCPANCAAFTPRMADVNWAHGTLVTPPTPAEPKSLEEDPESVVQLLDEEQPYLLLQIPSPRISDFAPGTVVELRFPGGKKGKGRVEEIPPQTSPIPTGNSATSGTVITAHVDPVGPLWPNLPFGSVVEVRRRR